jgi:hypothetical protein
MKTLGVRMYLGHGSDPCPIPGDCILDFTVVATNGLHSVDVQFCGCYGNAGGSHPRIQLLRAGLLPPTHIRPTSAFTFDVLDTFHLLTLQSKTNSYDFYLSLAHKSDNTGLLDIKVTHIVVACSAADKLCSSATSNSWSSIRKSLTK